MSFWEMQLPTPGGAGCDAALESACSAPVCAACNAVLQRAVGNSRMSLPEACERYRAWLQRDVLLPWFFFSDALQPYLGGLEEAWVWEGSAATEPVHAAEVRAQAEMLAAALAVKPPKGARKIKAWLQSLEQTHSQGASGQARGRRTGKRQPKYTDPGDSPGLDDSTPPRAPPHVPTGRRPGRPRGRPPKSKQQAPSGGAQLAAGAAHAPAAAEAPAPEAALHLHGYMQPASAAALRERRCLKAVPTYTDATETSEGGDWGDGDGRLRGLQGDEAAARQAEGQGCSAPLSAQPPVADADRVQERSSACCAGQPSGRTKAQKRPLVPAHVGKTAGKAARVSSAGRRGSKSQQHGRARKGKNTPDAHAAAAAAAEAWETQYASSFAAARTAPLTAWLPQLREQRRLEAVAVQEDGTRACKGSAQRGRPGGAKAGGRDAGKESSGLVLFGNRGRPRTVKTDGKVILEASWRTQVQRSTTIQLRFGRSRVAGWGVFAGERIPGNTMVVEYIGTVCRPALADVLEGRHQQAGKDDYLFSAGGVVVDATVSGGMARYINHSCDPNCEARVCRVRSGPAGGIETRIAIFTLAQIEAGTELCYDYKFPIAERDDELLPCSCGAAICRGYVNR